MRPWMIKKIEEDRLRKEEEKRPCLRLPAPPPPSVLPPPKRTHVEPDTAPRGSCEPDRDLSVDFTI